MFQRTMPDAPSVRIDDSGGSGGSVGSGGPKVDTLGDPGGLDDVKPCSQECPVPICAVGGRGAPAGRDAPGDDEHPKDEGLTSCVDGMFNDMDNDDGELFGGMDLDGVLGNDGTGWFT